MGEITILRDLAVVMIAAGVAALLFERLRLPKTLGYILVGVLISPHALSLVQSGDIVHTLADLGIMFLMFSLGLDFNLRKLRRVGPAAVVTAVLDVVIMVWIGYVIGRVIGLSAIESVFLGAILCDSSTTVLSKTLKDMDKMRESFATIVIGATIVEDVLAIGLIAMLTGGGFAGGLPAAGVAMRLVRLIAFLVVLLIVGLLTVPRLLVYAAKFKSEEVLVLAVLALCFGASLLAVRLEISLALGAFLVGAITAESRLIGRVELLVAPLRHMFTAAFFIAVGLLVQPALMLKHALPILGMTAVVVLGKTANTFVGTLITGNEPRVAFRSALSMAQICEFAFIIATLGLSLKVVGPTVYQVAVGVAVLTTLMNPYLLKHADRLADALGRFAPEGVRRNTTLYVEAVRRMASQYRDNAVRRTVRRSIWVILVNAAFIAAIFIAAGYAAQHAARLPEFASWHGEQRTILWIAAVLASLPFYVASARKMHALGMILAEVAVPPASHSPAAHNVRTLIASLMLFAGIVGMALVTFLLSSTLLPSLKTAVAVLVLVSLVTWLGWRKLIRMYSRAQTAVQDTFARELPPPKPKSVPVMIGALLDKDLEAVTIRENSPATGRAIQELQIRTQTGATVVSIERRGDVLLNPDSSVRLEAGDRVLLMGSADQTEAARKALAGE